jgi:nitric oxide synthase oxygenase domain/subunit
VPVDENHPTAELDEAKLLSELGHLYETRLDTLRFGADAAWQNSDRRVAELEGEYLRRHPGREVSARRERPDDSSR